MKILQIGFQHGAVQELSKQLKNKLNNLVIDALIVDLRLYNNPIKLKHINNYKTFNIKYPFIFRIPLLKQIYYFFCLFKCLSYFPNDYDVIHFFYFDYRYYFTLSRLKKKGKKIIITLVGSDFEKTTNFQKKFIYWSIKKSYSTTYANFKGFESISNKLGEQKSKIHNILFGLDSLNYLNNIQIKDIESFKKKYNIPCNCIVITCGINTSPSQQHLKIVDLIDSIIGKIMVEYILLFMFTYGVGTLEYIKSVEIKLKERNLRNICFKEFLPYHEIAILRTLSNIFINVQDTDALSATMQEYLYTRNIVITGSWLPYRQFDEIGIYYEKVDRIENLGENLLYCIQNYSSLKEKTYKNKDIIWRLSNWENNINDWIQLYT